MKLDKPKKLADALIRDSIDRENVSHTKFWSNVAYAAATAVFLYKGFTDGLSTEIWLIYLGVVGAHSAVSKYLSYRHGLSRDS